MRPPPCPSFQVLSGNDGLPKGKGPVDGSNEVGRKKGKWIVGNKHMKPSQAYPDEFGVAIISDLKKPFVISEMVGLIKSSVTTKLRKQKHEAEDRKFKHIILLEP